MSSIVATEFNPSLFHSILGEDLAEWHDFIDVNIRTFREGLDKLTAASTSVDMTVISEVRHALGPALQQWGVFSLERDLMALREEGLAEAWRLIEPEFKVLLQSLEALK